MVSPNIIIDHANIFWDSWSKIDLTFLDIIWSHHSNNSYMHIQTTTITLCDKNIPYMHTITVDSFSKKWVSIMWVGDRQDNSDFQYSPSSELNVHIVSRIEFLNYNLICKSLRNLRLITVVYSNSDLYYHWNSFSNYQYPIIRTTHIRAYHQVNTRSHVKFLA